MKPVPSGAVLTVVTPIALGSLQDEASLVAHSRMGELHQRHGEPGRGPWGRITFGNRKSFCSSRDLC